VRAKVVAEIAQDLVKTPKSRIWPHLEKALGTAPAGPARRGPVKAARSRKPAKAR
jgi:hypothetical protein